MCYAGSSHRVSPEQALADVVTIDIDQVRKLFEGPMSHSRLDLWSWNIPVVFGLFMKIQGSTTHLQCTDWITFC